MKMKMNAARARVFTPGFWQARNRIARRGVISHMRVLMLAALVLGACGSLTAGAGSGRASPSPTAPPQTVKITVADDHGTVTVHVGDRVQIALGEQYDWRLDPPDGVVLTHPVQNYMLVRGTQAIWLATAPGRSTVRATGTPACASGVACSQLALLFTATIDVIP